MKNLKSNSFLSNSIILHGSSILVSILFIALLLITYQDNRLQTHVFEWSSATGVSGSFLHPQGIYIWITIIILLLATLIISVFKKIKYNELATENFDEVDERDILLKNKLFREINLAEASIFTVIVIIIAVGPNASLSISVYDIGLVLSAYLGLRSLILLVHTIYRQHS